MPFDFHDGGDSNARSGKQAAVGTPIPPAQQIPSQPGAGTANVTRVHQLAMMPKPDPQFLPNS